MSDDHHLGEDLVALALDDEAALARHASHLEGCADCRRALEESRRVMIALAIPAEAPSAAFDRGVWARLDAVDAEARGSWWATLFGGGAGGGRPWLGWAGAGAGVAACAAVLAVVLLRGPSGAPGEPESGADEVRALASVEDVELTENLELLDDLDLVEALDAIEDLEVIETLDEGTPG